MKPLTFCTSLMALLSLELGHAEHHQVKDPTPTDSNISITIHPTTTRSINGISQVDRRRYFALAESGRGLENSLQTPERFNFVTQDLETSLGRSLGPVQRVTKYSNSVIEDVERPGFADLAHLRQSLAKRRRPPSAQMRRLFGQNFHIAAHEKHHPFPKFFGKYSTPESKNAHGHQYLPANIAAAAELTATVMHHAYDDVTRPAFYEPVNEPHWSFFNNKHFADWHLATFEKVKAACPEIQVGGPCMSVPYFYRNYYRSFNGMRNFMENTDGRLDFYSFHVYDYYRNAEAGQNATRITGGLPLEGVLDLVNNYAVHTFNKEVPLVISEHGGYTLPKENTPQAYDGEWLAQDIHRASTSPSKEGFASELERRSIVQWLHLSSILTNTLSFMDHPHSVQKAVPFILANTENWDPRYYASLYVPKNYRRGAALQEGFLSNFYKFFQGVDGRRIVAHSPDPDLQTRAFVDGKTVYTIINNLSTAEHTISLNGLQGATHHLRRISRGAELIPSYTVGALPSTKNITLHGRDAILVVSTYAKPLPESAHVLENIYYGDQITVKTTPETPIASFKVQVPNATQSQNATLRVSIDRGPGSDYRVAVVVNGHLLQVPMEDAAKRYDDTEGGYASTKLIPLPPEVLKADNTIKVSFPDGKEGAVGSVVIRACFPKS